VKGRCQGGWKYPKNTKGTYQTPGSKGWSMVDGKKKKKPAPVVDLLALFVYGSNSMKERVAPGIGALVLGLGDLGILRTVLRSNKEGLIRE